MTMLLTEKDTKRLCQKLIGFVKADDATVSVSSEQQSHLRFAANGFTTSGSRENVSAQVTVWIKRKRGSASTNGMDEDSLKAAVAQAEQLAGLSPVDVEYLPTLDAQTYKPVNGYVAATAKIEPNDRAKAINDAIAACEKSNVVGAGFHRATATAGGSATKNGNFSFERSTSVSFGMTARTPDGGSSGYF